MELHDNISRNSYGNAVVGRYGGCFEEDVQAYVQENKRKSSHGFWMYWRSMHNSQCEKRAMHSTEEASKFGWWKCQNRSLTLVKKNSQVYCKQLAGSTLSAWLTFTPRRAVHGGTSTPLDPSTFTHNLVITNHFSDMESYQVQLHLQQFQQSLQYGTSLKTIIH